MTKNNKSKCCNALIIRKEGIRRCMKCGAIMDINKGGRPQLLTQELSDKICEELSAGKSLKRICEDEDMPSRRIVHIWLLDKTKEWFFHNYEKAINIRTENMFDELEEIADQTDEKESPNRSRLRVDTRKWYLGKVMPKKFGDKIDHTTDGEKIESVIYYIPQKKKPDEKLEDADEVKL